MFVPSNGASKSFLSSSVKLTLNEATSLNSRELLQIPFTEFLQILKRNLWAEINVRPLDLSKFAGNASVSTARGQNNL